MKTFFKVCQNALVVLLTVAAFFLSMPASAQNVVKGTVVEADGQTPVIGASVLQSGTKNGVVTDLDGNFSISVPQGATLEVSCIGFATVEVAAKNGVKIVLKEDTTFLDEIVVVAYGTQRKKDLTGSLSEVKSEIVAIQNTSTISRALEGSAPGLQVASVDGQPGLDMAIRLRGVSSTNGDSAAALIVIDGVPQQTNSMFENPLSQLNHEDIESISILKDAASTALYGSRAGNGVVLITTKKGREGKAKISFQARLGWNALGNYSVNAMDNAADYYEYAWQSIYNSYRYGVVNGMPGVDANGFYYTNVNNPNHTDEEARLFASQHLFDYTGSETSFSRNVLKNNMAYSVPGAKFTPTGSGTDASATMSGAYLIDPTTGKLNPSANLLYTSDPTEIMLQNSFRQEYNVSAQGGSDKVHYFMSFGYQDEPSYLLASDYKRFSGRANVDAQITKWLKLGANVGYSKTITNAQTGYWGPRQIGGNAGNAMYQIKGWQPIVPIYIMDENGYALDDSGERQLNVGNKSYSPLGQVGSPLTYDFLQMIETNKERQNITTWTTRLFADVNFLKYFNFHATFNMDDQRWRRDMYQNGSVSNRPAVINGKGGYYIRSYDRTIINTQQLLTYNQDFGKAHVDAMIGHEYEDISKKTLNYGTTYELITGVLVPGNFLGRYTNVGGATGTSPSFAEDIYRTESYLSRVNFNYDQKYYFSASFRRDAASKFTADNRWGNFWSVGAGWRFSEEPFLKSAKSWLDNAKLRASYGVTGNSNGLTSWYLNSYWTYSASTWNTGSAGSYTGTPATFSINHANTLVNKDITWENVHQFDLGLDFSVLKSRITGAIDFYNNNTVNSLFNQIVSPLASVGKTSLTRNAAVLTNRGIELELSADIIRTTDFTLNVNLNGTHYRTILQDVPDDQIPAWDETMDLPKGTWTAQTEDMGQAGTADHKNRGIIYLRGEGKDLFNMYIPRYAGIGEDGLPLYWHRVTYYDVNVNPATGKYDHGGRYAEYQQGDNVKTNVASDYSYYEVGSATPDWIGGITLNLNWKNFDLSIVGAYQFGGYFFSREYANHLYRGSSQASSLMTIPISKDLIGNTWTPTNTGAGFPMQWWTTSTASNYTLDGSYLDSNHGYTDMALFDASYFRLKNITLGYTFPTKLLKKIDVSALRIFASADNLLIFSRAQGVDPTFSTIGGKEVDTYIYPQMQTFTFGVNLDF